MKQFLFEILDNYLSIQLFLRQGDEMMGDVIRFLISNDSAIDNMTEEDILELATFGDDYIPNDIENLFADFCPGFEDERGIFLSENPEICLKIEKRASLMKEKYLSNLSDEEDLDEYEDALTQMCIDFIKKYPVFKKYYLKINYYDEDENLLKEEFI